MKEDLDRAITAIGLLSGTSPDGIDTALDAQVFAYLAVRMLAGFPLNFPATSGTSAPTSGGRLEKRYG